VSNSGSADLLIEGVGKRFGEVVALDRVSLQVAQGELLTILGFLPLRSGGNGRSDGEKRHQKGDRDGSVHGLLLAALVNAVRAFAT